MYLEFVVGFLQLTKCKSLVVIITERFCYAKIICVGFLSKCFKMYTLDMDLIVFLFFCFCSICGFFIYQNFINQTA